MYGSRGVLPRKRLRLFNPHPVMYMSLVMQRDAVLGTSPWKLASVLNKLNALKCVRRHGMLCPTALV
jgi:hypothetical protein